MSYNHFTDDELIRFVRCAVSEEGLGVLIHNLAHRLENARERVRDHELEPTGCHDPETLA